MDWSSANFYELLDIMTITLGLLYLKPGTGWNTVSAQHTYVDILNGLPLQHFNKCYELYINFDNFTLKVCGCINTAKRNL